MHTEFFYPGIFRPKVVHERDPPTKRFGRTYRKFDSQRRSTHTRVLHATSQRKCEILSVSRNFPLATDKVNCERSLPRDRSSRNRDNSPVRMPITRTCVQRYFDIIFIAKYMYILKLSLIPLGAVTIRNRYVVCERRESHVWDRIGTHARIRTGNEKERKKKSTTAFGNFAETRYAWHAAVIASSGFKCLRGRRPVARAAARSRRILRAWYTGCSQTGAREMKRSSRTFSSVSLLNGEFSHLQNQSATVSATE